MMIVMTATCVAYVAVVCIDHVKTHLFFLTPFPYPT